LVRANRNREQERDSLGDQSLKDQRHSVLQLLLTANAVPSSLILSLQLVFLRSVLQLLLTANAVPSSLILSIQLVFLRSVLQLLLTANAVPSSLILSI
jgi:hypothetical protein